MKISKILNLLFVTILCSSCNKTTSITKTDLLKKYPSLNFSQYYNYTFFGNDEIVGIGLIQDDSISNYKIYNKIKPDLSNLSKIFNLYDLVKYFGEPFQYGVYKSHSIDYTFDVENIYRFYLQGDEDIISYEVLDKENPSSWVDESKEIFPTLDEVQSITYGMSLDDVVKLIGKPQKSIGSGLILYGFDIDNYDKSAIISFRLDYEKELEYCSQSDTRIFGTHFLYVYEIFYDYI